MESKESVIMEIFFNNPTKEWHFEELLKDTKIARSKLSVWLRKFIKNKVIKKIKSKSRMPYYISNYESIEYKNCKRLFGIRKLYDSGLIDHLSKLTASTIIIFGSFSRSDWYKGSDIDIFVYGDIDGLKTSIYETRLEREIQIFHCSNKKDMKKYSSALIKNIIKGDIVKGDIDFVKVEIDA